MNLTYYTDGNGFFYQGDKIEETHREATLEEIKALQKTRKAEQKRLERDSLLDMTDKFMLVDFPLSDAEREKYIEYRKYLRDIPENENFPDVDVKTFVEWNQ